MDEFALETFLSGTAYETPPSPSNLHGFTLQGLLLLPVKNLLCSSMASMVTAPPPSQSRPPPDPPPFPSPDVRRSERSPPQLLHVRLDLQPLKQLPSFVKMMVTALLHPLVSLSPATPPEPPDPPDTSVVALIHFLNTFSSLSLVITRNSDPVLPSPTLESRGCDVPILYSGVSSSVYGCLFPRPFPQAFTQISTLTSKNGGGLPVSTSDTPLAYGLHSPVVYRSPFGFVNDTSFAYGLHFPVIYRSLLGCVDWSPISSCFDLPTMSCKVFHAHLSSFFFTYSATIEWFRQLIVWVTLDLRFMFLVDDILMGLISFGYTFATSGSIYIALPRSSAVCSFLTGSNPDAGVVCVYFSSWWQVEEKLIVIFIPMNMDIAGYDFSLVPRLNQSSLLMYPPIWSELDEQVSLVLQGSSSHRMLSSAYGAVSVVLRVTLDAVFEEAYVIVVIQFHIALFVICIAILSFMLLLFVCLAVNSLFVSSSFGV